MRYVTRVVSLAVTVLFACSLSGEAQVVTGSMIGLVMDESSGVLPGVTVTATSPARPAGPVVVVTNERGEYRLAALPPGTYELWIELPGFQTYVEQDVLLTIGRTIERNVTLPLATVAETVTVTGESPVVDPRQTQVTQSLPQEAVDAIPVSRGGLGSWMSAMPGVTSSNYSYGGTGVNVMGSANRDTSYIIDGMYTNHVATGSSWSWHDLDAAAEINLTTLGASAEYQVAQGGVMNLISKSGTNAFHGDAQLYFLPKGLVSQPIKLDCNCPLGESGFRMYRYRDWSTHVGGPIVKDRVWFHTGITATGPSIRNPGAPDRPREHWLIQGETRSITKVQWQINNNLHFQQNFNYEFWNWFSPIFPSPSRPLETLRLYPGDMRFLGSQLTATLGPRTVLTARYFRSSMPYGYIGLGPNLNADELSQTTPGRRDTFTGVSRDNATSPGQAFEPRRDDVNVKVNHYISTERMTHNIRFGVQLARNRDTGQAAWPGGVLFLDFKGAPDLAQFEPPTVYSAAYQSRGVWFEDEINIGRMTIVPGVRFDRMRAYSPPAPEFDPTEVNTNGGLCRCVVSFEKTGGEIPGRGDMFTWNKISPRVGINVRLTSDNRTVLRATAGRYYRAIYINDYTGVHPGLGVKTLMEWDPATGDYTTLVSVTDPFANIGVDPDIDAPYSDQYSIAVERELGRNLGFTVTYVRKEGRNLIGWQDVGGVYGTQEVTAPNGQTVEVFPLLNSPSDRLFVRTNPAGFFTRYNGLILAVNRRYADRWMLNANYTYSKTEGLDIPPGGSTFASSRGQDPNDRINRTGRQSFDRPHMFGLTGAYEIPKIETQVSSNLSIVSGFPHGAQLQVRLPQGRRRIYFTPPGAFRRQNESWLILRVSKMLLRDGARRLELGVEMKNLLQETAGRSLASEVFLSPNFGVQTRTPHPRLLMLRVRAYF